MKSSTVKGVIALLAAASALGFAAPASAIDNVRAAQANRQADAPADPDRMICVRTQLTGSRLMRRICRTAAEWAEDGEVPTR